MNNFEKISHAEDAILELRSALYDIKAGELLQDDHPLVMWIKSAGRELADIRHRLLDEVIQNIVPERKETAERLLTEAIIRNNHLSDSDLEDVAEQTGLDYNHVHALVWQDKISRLIDKYSM